MGQLLGIVTAAAQLGLQSLVIKPKRQIGPFTAQVTIDEVHTDELEITEHPVEMGASIADHAYKRPAEVTIRCSWSNSPTADGFVAGLVGAVTGTVSGVSSLLSGQSLGQVREVYQNLLQLQEQRIPFDVLTGKRNYSNMLVKTLRQETNKDTENSLMITATLRQVIIVTTQTVMVKTPTSAQQDPQATGATVNQGTKQLTPAPNYNTRRGQ
jgi:hypothetical protein